MAWIGLMLFSWILVILLVRNPGIRTLWPAGLAAVAVTLILDITLVQLGAFRFNDPIYALWGLPVFYVLGNFANGLILTRFVPADGVLKPIITVGFAVLFLAVEWLFIIIGYFQHLNWTLLHSLGLNIIGMITVLWVADLLDLRQHNSPWPVYLKRG